MADRLKENPKIPEYRRKAYAGGDPVLIEEELEAPLKLKKPGIIGINFMGDLFHDKVRVDYIDRIIDIIGRCPQHTFVVLTKRPENIEEKLFTFYSGKKKRKFSDYYLPQNVWLGVTCENQKAADERIPILLSIKASVRFISIEPMLGPIDLVSDRSIASDRVWLEPYVATLDWVVLGGESGPGARPIHPDWVRSIRDQCMGVGTPFFFKQWGEWIQCDVFNKPKRVGKKKAGRILDGKEWKEFPT